MEKVILAIVLIFVLMNISIAEALQTFTYKIDNSGMQMALYESDTLDSDYAFRYKEMTLFSCVNNLLTGDTQKLDLNFNVLDVDCNTYSLYNMINFIRENSNQMSMVLGSSIDDSEKNAAMDLALFFNINNVRRDSELTENIFLNENIIVIGNSNLNSITARLSGTWSYNSGESIIRLIENKGKLKIIIAGTSSADAVKAMQSLKDYTDYFESFNGNCLVLTGCEKVISADANNNGILTLTETLFFADRWINGQVGLDNILDAINLWLRS